MGVLMNSSKGKVVVFPIKTNREWSAELEKNQKAVFGECEPSQWSNEEILQAMLCNAKVQLLQAIEKSGLID